MARHDGGARDGRIRRGSRSLLLTAVAAVVALIAWTAVLGVGVIEGWWRRPLASEGDTRAFLQAAKAMIDRQNAGNVAFVLMENGKVAGEHFVSIGRPVDRDTLFQVASLSKWVTAWGVMTLVDAGKINLDAPVSTYLRRWRLPASEFDVNGVTVRRLLSHTAGLTDGLGYGGFAPGAPLQSLEASLTKASDASPGADGRVRVGAPPGESFRYSGGGYALLQLVVEDVTGERFDAYMRRAVLDPLGMTRSTYVLENGVANLAQFFDVDGSEAIHYRFTATAAASLYASARDLTRFVQAHVAGAGGEAPGRGVLRPATVEDMRRPHAYQFGVEVWGLGTILFAPNNAGSFIIGHDGLNTPAINTTARVDPAGGDGIVVLETGHLRLATNLAGEWVFWRTGNVDLFVFVGEAQRMLPVLVGGGLVILLGALLAGWRIVARRRRSGLSTP